MVWSGFERGRPPREQYLGYEGREEQRRGPGGDQQRMYGEREWKRDEACMRASKVAMKDFILHARQPCHPPRSATIGTHEALLIFGGTSISHTDADYLHLEDRWSNGDEMETLADQKSERDLQ